ncbi:MAG: hypothetical protein EOM50_07350 [Erysipelotrichia bacterium]|nr:hypothetical protein [Erysipelotrichia bacterium]NCC54352.1 hypothetical protein [Erysipelotrichia bacterium]
MNERKYKESLEQIKASEEFKEHLKQEMHKAQTNNKERQMNKQTKQHNHLFKFAIVGMFMIVIACTYIFFHSINKTEEKIVERIPQEKELPILTLTASIDVGGLGFEGYSCYRAEDLMHDNPYDVKQIHTVLPVYQNLNIEGRFGMYGIKRFSEEKERSYLANYAEKLLLKEYEISIEEDWAKLESEMCEIWIQGKTRTSIAFQDAYRKKMDTIIKEDDNKQTVKKKIAKLIKQKEFSALFPMQKVGIDVQLMYSSDNEQNKMRAEYFVSVYEKEKQQAHSLLNRQFEAIELTFDEEGKLASISIPFTQTKKDIGNYPIIDLTHAKQRLKEGHYYTNNGGHTSTMDKIAYVEVVYLKNGTLDYFMPYYKFYALANEQDKVIKIDDQIQFYIAYYVPAIETKYLLNMPNNETLSTH